MSGWKPPPLQPKPLSQSHILLLYKFPEDDSEVFMPYLLEELQTAKEDAENFADMYPEVLYVTIVEVGESGSEYQIWTWNNPQAATLLRRLSNAGPAHLQYPTTSDFAAPVGGYAPNPTRRSTTSPLGARPPSAEQFASPLPATSQTYGGRKLSRRRTRR